MQRFSFADPGRSWRKLPGLPQSLINAGTVTVTTSEDHQSIATAKVDLDQPASRFDFLPEGTYTIAISDARDVTRTYKPLPPGSLMMPEFTETTLRTYAAATGTLLVQSDQTGYLLSVPPKTKAAQ